MFFHCRNINHVYFDTVEQHKPDFDDGSDCALFLPALQWLETKTDFFPLFLAVRNTNMTGYSFDKTNVLFEWTNPPNKQIVFTDYTNWHIALNSIRGSRIDETLLTKYCCSLIFKPSYSYSKWIRFSDNHDVQAVVPSVDLTSADFIYCHSANIKSDLITLGFNENKIIVKQTDNINN